jgi:hypothetical protein
MTSAETKTPGVSKLPFPLPSAQVANGEQQATKITKDLCPALHTATQLTLPLRQRLRKPLPRMSPPIVVFRLPGVQHGLFECGGVLDV